MLHGSMRAVLRKKRPSPAVTASCFALPRKDGTDGVLSRLTIRQRHCFTGKTVEGRSMTRREFWRINVLIWVVAALGVVSIVSLIWR